jgi:hypothetical protein
MHVGVQFRIRVFAYAYAMDVTYFGGIKQLGYFVVVTGNGGL